jgi:hypothetical protein
MFLNIFFVHHNSTAAAEHGSVIHGRLQPFRSALQRRTRHISSGLAVFVPLLRVAVAPSNALNHIAALLTKRMQQMIDGGLRSV